MSGFTYNPPTSALDIVHIEDQFLIVNKPSGLLSVPGKTEDLADCLEARLWSEFGDTLLIHRLDMDTSGLMVFARKKSAQRNLNLQFEKRTTDKEYVALVEGHIEADTGQIDQPMQSDWPNRPLQKIDPNGKTAVTYWKVLDQRQKHNPRCVIPENRPITSVARAYEMVGASDTR